MDLWPHQRDAVKALLDNRNYALWWTPGVGKTAPLAVAGMKLGARQLWLTPASLRAQAAKEIAKFRGDEPRIQIIRSGKDDVDYTADVVICSYELVRTVPVWTRLFKLSWGSLVCDEAHRLANHMAATTRAVYGARPTSKGALYLRASHVWIATGTPVTAYPDQLWPHMSRLWPTLGTPGIGEWRDHFCVIRKSDFGIQVVGGKNLDELRRRLQQAGSRLTLDETREMPPLLVDTLELTAGKLDLSGIEPQQREELEAILAEPDADDAWSRLMNLAPALATLRARIALAKAGAVSAIVTEELDGGLDRVVVFGCHIEALQHVTKVLDYAGSRLIIGATPQKERDEAIAAFEKGDCRVLVGNVQSIGTGLNLQCAARAVFLDASWSPAQNEQAIHRVFRSGQARSVRVSFSSLIGSVDQQVQRVLTRKSRILAALN
jgi:SNF2 family DNA or RNA helicase